MSEKVIDFADFSYMCRLGLYKPCTKNCSEEICEEWKLLKTPTLADVCGKRELKDMTEEELKSLFDVYKQFNPNAKMTINWKLVVDGIVTMIEDDEFRCAFAIAKWATENGFNVLGEAK